MKTELEELHGDIILCQKCRGLLGSKQNHPRPGFPPSNVFEIVVIGAEPGPGATEPFDLIEYHRAFTPRTKNTNRVRLFFEALHADGINFEKFYFTNTVKCPSTRSQSRKCFEYCGHFLEKQIKIINPKLIVVLGRAAHKLQVRAAKKNSINESEVFGCKAITICHPQGSSIKYRELAATKIINTINKLTT